MEVILGIFLLIICITWAEMK